MARDKLTKTTVDKARPGLCDAFIWDSDLPGFGLKSGPLAERSTSSNIDSLGRSDATRSVAAASI